MKRHARRVGLGLLVIAAVAVPVFALAEGDVEVLLVVPNDEHPEGVAFDRDGNLYFGNRIDTPGGFASELRKITPDGKKDTVIAEFAVSPGSALLGLVADGDGNVWAAVHAGPDHGVWKVSGNGKHKERIDGSTDINFPNALTFDAEGNLYVTDSGPVFEPVGGGIWRLAKGASSFELWSDDPALAPFGFDPFPGFTLPGANGIAFFPPDTLYVANTEKGQIFRIPILADGSAGEAEAVTELFAVPSVDGLAVDVHGNIHAVLPGHALLPLFGLPPFPPVVQVDPDTGVPVRETLAEFDDGFDNPLSLAFDTLPGERTSVVVTNGNIVPIPGVGPGPRLLRANVGVKGFMLK